MKRVCTKAEYLLQVIPRAISLQLCHYMNYAFNPFGAQLEEAYEMNNNRISHAHSHSNMTYQGAFYVSISGLILHVISFSTFGGTKP